MGRDLDTTYATGLAAPSIMPIRLVELDLNSGTQYVWSGVGPLVWNGHTFSGVGSLGEVGPIAEGTGVEAHGTTVKLSGIALSDIDWPAPPATPPDPPFTPPAGQSVAWAFAHYWSQFVMGTGGPVIGYASSTQTTANIAMSAGDPLGQNGYGADWATFPLPPEIPPGATIAGIYPVVRVSGWSPGAFQQIEAFPTVVGSVFGPDLGTIYGPNLGSAIESTSIVAYILNTLEGPADLSIDIDFVGMAVYYEGTPLPKASMLYEAMNDVHVGGTARIWRGLMQDGALLGVPYQVFRGYIDTDDVDISAETFAITLALESRIVDLGRACYRRYTTPDQRLAYPTDIGFNWMELLQDTALKTGT